MNLARKMGIDSSQFLARQILFIIFRALQKKKGEDPGFMIFEQLAYASRGACRF